MNQQEVLIIVFYSARGGCRCTKENQGFVKQSFSLITGRPPRSDGSYFKTVSTSYIQFLSVNVSLIVTSLGSRRRQHHADIWPHPPLPRDMRLVTASKLTAPISKLLQACNKQSCCTQDTSSFL